MYKQEISMDKFGKRLGELIKESGLTQLTIAKETGINNNTISLIVNGSRNPTWEQAHKLLSCFKSSKDANYFFQDTLSVEENDAKYGYDPLSSIDKTIEDLQRLRKHLLEK